MKIKPFIVKIISALCPAMAIAFAACSPDTTTSLIGTGRINPSVTVNTDVVVADGQISHDIVPSTPAPSLFSLRLTDLLNGTEHTWTPWTDYDPMAGVLASTYDVEAFYGDSIREGFDAPWFNAVRRVTVSDGASEDVSLDCRLANSILRLSFSDEFRSSFTSFSAKLHSVGHSYVDYPSDETRPVYLSPGNISVFLQLTFPDGKTADFVAAHINNVREAYFYDFSFDVSELTDGTKAIVVSFDPKVTTDDEVIPLTEEFINAPQPVLTPSGFEAGHTVTAVEGVAPESRLAVSTATAWLSHLMLTVKSPSSSLADAPAEIDLINAPGDVVAALAGLGITLSEQDGVTTVDFTEAVSRLRSSSAGNITDFELLALSRFNKVSEPCLLRVDIIPVDLTVESVSKAVMGVNVCEMLVTSPVDPSANLKVQTADAKGIWHDAEVISVNEESAGHYRVRFRVPSGQLPVPVRTYYCDQLRNSVTVERVSPDFSIAVDPFALKADITILPADESMRALITSMASVFAGDVQVAVIDRDEESGRLTVAGLSGDTRYSLRASVFDMPSKPSDFTQPVEIRTEKCIQFENGSFEDTKQTLKYSDLPSGGRYSQSVVPIYNQQNKVQINLHTPKNWATVNDKTFCRKAANPNTWYMQPSAYTVDDCYSGGLAVKIVSTAWDAKGDPIREYRQESQPYVGYSRVIPQIAHRAAGRLFLGSYSYDPVTDTETYVEGIDFASRPSAVSGFYKYIPCSAQPSDRGLVEVEVLAIEGDRLVTIGSGRGLLTSSTDYRAFSVPVTYTRPGLKAARIRVLFASTSRTGDIAYESANVVTVNDPVTASSLGSELWIDEISFTY